MRRFLQGMAFGCVFLLILAAGGAVAVSQPNRRVNESRLNVVLILVDDLGWMDLSCQGSDYFRTPHIDRLASQGMRFTDAYAACAVCSPTRAAVMTGRWPARVGVTDWIRARFQRPGSKTPAQNPTAYVGGRNRKLLCPPNPFWMEDQQITIAEILKAAGYATAHIGKWHLGDPDWYPASQGFDVNIAGCDIGQPPSYFDPYTHPRYNFDQQLKPRRQGEYLTHREGFEAQQFIRAHADRPFFLSYCPYAVHTPIQAIQEVAAKYATDGKKPVQARYAAMVESVDDAVGMIEETLRETSVADRTLVIFTSDNGGLLGPTDNAPLRSGKGYAYEGGIRVPFLVRWPGQVAAGTESSQPVCSVDVLPTIAEAVGVDLPQTQPVDGVSLAGLLKSGGDKPLGRDTLYWHFPHYRHRPGPYSIIRAGHWKLIKWYEGGHELYNLAEDLSEFHNRSAELPDKTAQLETQLMAELKRVGAKLPRPNPNYRPKPQPE